MFMYFFPVGFLYRNNSSHMDVTPHGIRMDPPHPTESSASGFPFVAGSPSAPGRSFGGVDVSSWVVGGSRGRKVHIFFRKSLNIEILDLCCCW